MKKTGYNPPPEGVNIEPEFTPAPPNFKGLDWMNNVQLVRFVLSELGIPYNEQVNESEHIINIDNKVRSSKIEFCGIDSIQFYFDSDGKFNRLLIEE